MFSDVSIGFLLLKAGNKQKSVHEERSTAPPTESRTTSHTVDASTGVECQVFVSVQQKERRGERRNDMTCSWPARVVCLFHHWLMAASGCFLRSHLMAIIKQVSTFSYFSSSSSSSSCWLMGCKNTKQHNIMGSSWGNNGNNNCSRSSIVVVRNDSNKSKRRRRRRRLPTEGTTAIKWGKEEEEEEEEKEEDRALSSSCLFH